MTHSFPQSPTECRQMEAMLPPFVDGCASPEVVRVVAAHLEGCQGCRESVEVQREIRALLVARRSGLAEAAPPGLAADLSRAVHPALVGSWRPWLSPLAAAAAVVLALGGTLVWATGHSSVLLAAQLTLDHLKCFVIDGDAHAHDVPLEAAEASMQQRFGEADLTLPELPGDGRAHLVAMRECLFGDGWVPHALYRVEGQPVSLFVLRGAAPSPAVMNAFGRRAVVLTQGQSSYLLVAPAGLGDVATAVGLGAQ